MKYRILATILIIGFLCFGFIGSYHFGAAFDNADLGRIISFAMSFFTGFTAVCLLILAWMGPILNKIDKLL